MAKRKCVRQAIIEVSDCESDEADDCSIVKSNHMIGKIKDTQDAMEITSINRQGQRSRVGKVSKKGESQKSSNKKRGKSATVKDSLSPIEDKKEGIVSGRKRKRSESIDTKMGLLNSKLKENKAKKFRDKETIKREKKLEELQFSGNLQEEERLPQILNQQTQKPMLQQQKLQLSNSLMSTTSETRNVSLTHESNETKTILTESKPNSNDTPETYLARLAESKVYCVEWTDVDYIQDKHGLNRRVAENIVNLFKEDNTIPFIARYRKTMTSGMDADELRNVKNSCDRVKLIKQKANAIIKEIDKQGKWTPEFHTFVHGTKSLNDLEHIQSMFKLTKSTLAERAREVGLGVPAQAIMKAQKIEPLHYLVNPKTEGLKTEDQVRDGIVCILADTINKDESTFEQIKMLRNKYSLKIETNKVKSTNKVEKEPKTNKQKDDEVKYDLYHNFSSLDCNLKPHQILAINRGESRKVLTVKVNVPPQFEHGFKGYCATKYEYACKVSHLHRALLTAAFDYAWTKSIKSTVGRRTRHELNERAEIASMDVFAENVKQLLLTPPVRGKVVLGVDPGFRHGCKLAVVSEQGDVLQTETIYPHNASNSEAKKEAERTLVHLVKVHKCTIFALGNGTACRETQVFLSELIKKRAFEPLDVAYTIVDETGASIYSCSREATTEFPNLDVNVVSAISIARRLQDPMAELVKIEPKHLGVGMYQHDLPEKQLAAKLNEVIMEAVSFVGVDINTASVSLLKRVAGLGDSKANNIIEWRKSSGPFKTRNDLKKVRGIGSKTFEQCAGFIRIIPETAIGNDNSKQNSLNYLDQTWIHPESYDTAKAFVIAAKCNLNQIGTKPFILAVTSYAKQGYSELGKKFNTSAETMKIIVEGLSMEKGQDIRAKADKSMFRKSLTSFDDLTVGTILTGVVRNNTHFGAFVDVGLERAGLIHTTQMKGVTLSIGQRVEVTVQNIEKDRKRLGLTLVHCF